MIPQYYSATDRGSIIGRSVQAGKSRCGVKKITYDGRTLSVAEWGRVTGIPPTTILSRLRHGWPADRALTATPDRRFRRGGRHKSATPRPCPRLRRHKLGQAFCVWSAAGKRHYRYFGKWASVQANRAYSQFAAEWSNTYSQVAHGQSIGATVFVIDIAERYQSYADTIYVKNGKRTAEADMVRLALQSLVQLYSDKPVREFNCDHLRAVQSSMVSHGYARKTINGNIARILRCFSYGVSRNIVESSVYETLKHIEPLVAGRTAAPEYRKVKPAPAADIDAVVASEKLHPHPGRRAVLADMIRVQRLTGMRPNELCVLTTDDIERSNSVWIYTVGETNKTLHRGKPRIVMIGPRAQSILAPYLACAMPGEPVFMMPGKSPHDTVRKIAVSRGQYCKWIRAACAAVGVPEWTPHQLRHTYATDISRKYEDDEIVAKLIGDTPEVAREVYIDPDDAVKRRIVLATG